MNETSLTGALIETCGSLMMGSVTLKINARLANAGYPDLTHTWKKMTSWWEVKHYASRMFGMPELQKIMCRRLALAGTCHYIIYEERRAIRRTLIVHPEMMYQWQDAPDYVDGFNHRWVCQFMGHLHILSAKVP